MQMEIQMEITFEKKTRKNMSFTSKNAPLDWDKLIDLDIDALQDVFK
jgi:dsDNA-binding SOS-regulon protein